MVSFLVYDRQPNFHAKKWPIATANEGCTPASHRHSSVRPMWNGRASA